MKKFLLLLVLGAATVAALPATADAAVQWPASCRTMTCVNAHLNNLDARARLHSVKQTATINALKARLDSLEASRTNMLAKLGCIGERDIWRNYSFDYYGNYLPFLDITASSGVATANGPFFFLTNICSSGAL